MSSRDYKYFPWNQVVLYTIAIALSAFVVSELSWWLIIPCALIFWVTLMARAAIVELNQDSLIIRDLWLSTANHTIPLLSIIHVTPSAKFLDPVFHRKYWEPEPPRVFYIFTQTYIITYRNANGSERKVSFKMYNRKKEDRILGILATFDGQFENQNPDGYGNNGLFQIPSGNDS
jgi:hypothetical protein